MITPKTFDIIRGVKKLFYKHDLGEPMQLGADTGDTVADKKTEVNGGEAVEQGGDDLLS